MANSSFEINGSIIASSGSFIVGSGSAGSPSFEFSGDTDTGMFSPAINTIALATSGVERLRVDSIGNVGIGTATPAYQLDVSGIANIGNNLRINSQVASTIAGFDGSKNVISLSTETYPSLTELSYVKGLTSAIQTQINSKQNTLTNPVTGVGTSGYLAKWISSSGISSGVIFDNGTNVGIGTTSPTANLSVTGNAVFGQTGSSIGATVSVKRIGNNYNLELVGATDGVTNFAVQGASTNMLWTSRANYFDIQTNSAGKGLALTTNGGSLFLSSGGFVGIGTTAPSGQLHVVGTGTFDNSIRLGSSSTSGTIIGLSTSGTVPAIVFDTVGNNHGNQQAVYDFRENGVSLISIDGLGNLQANAGNIVGVAANPSADAGSFIGHGMRRRLTNAGMEFLWGENITSVSEPGIDLFPAGGTHISSGILFRLSKDSNKTDVAVIVDGSGRVGIGTSTPSGQLHVIGTGLFSNSIGINTNTTSVGATPYALLVDGDVSIGSGNAGRTLNVWSNNSTKKTVIKNVNGTSFLTYSIGSQNLNIGGPQPNDTPFNTINYYAGNPTPSTASHRFHVSVDGTGIAPIAVITNSGLGIGTTTPSGHLDVAGDVYVRGTGNNLGTIYFKSQAVGDKALYIGATNGGDIVINGNGPNAQFSSQGGYVNLLGSSTQMHIGHSYDAGNTSQIIRFLPAAREMMRMTTSGTLGIGLPTSASSYAGNSVQLFNQQPYANTRVHIAGSGADSGSAALIVTNSGISPLLYVRNDGNIGIGTTSPVSPLHVVGSGRFVGSNGNTIIINATNENGAVSIDAPSSLYNDISLRVNSQNIFRGLDGWTATWADSAATTYFQVGRAAGNTMFTSLVGNAFNRLAYSSNKYLFTNQTTNITVPSNYFNIEYNGTSILSATTGGSVGIGTTTPSGQLHVIGSGIFSSGLFVGSTPVSVSGHSHTSSDITNFNSSVSGLINGIYAPLNSPALIGVPTVPTASSGTNTTQIASTAFVRTEISNLVASAPSALDTLNELAAALGNDANFSTTVTNNLAGKANLSGATFTGSISGPSGNFVSLKSNGTDVSVVGHTHTSSNITDFSSSVSGLLPTIANSGDNRILTSTGSTVGVTAESNLTFDGNLLNVTGSGLFASGLNLSNQTANTIASFDSSKNLTSLSTATYPSLTELSYLKGATSSLQTQINSKQNTLTNPVTGTGVSSHIAYWNSSSGIVADSGQLVWNSTDNRLGIGTTTPSGQLHVVGTGLFSSGLGINTTNFNFFDIYNNNRNATVSVSGDVFIQNALHFYNPSEVDNRRRGLISSDGDAILNTLGVGEKVDTLGNSVVMNTNGLVVNNAGGTGGSACQLLGDYGAIIENILIVNSNSNGNATVGIGTSTPSASLDVVGDVNIDGNLTFDSFTESVVSNGNSGTSKTLSLASGTVHTCTLTGNCTFTMPTTTAGKSFTMFLNSGSGNYTASFSGVRWADSATPTATILANKVDIYSFTSDGSYWYGSFSQNYG